MRCTERQAHRRSWEWKPWEARRTSAPKGLPREVKEARWEAKLLLLVVRTRLAQGEVPLEHAAALAEVAQDERLPPRRRRVAAQYLARMRLVAMGRAEGPRG